MRRAVHSGARANPKDMQSDRQTNRQGDAGRGGMEWESSDAEGGREAVRRPRRRRTKKSLSSYMRAFSSAASAAVAAAAAADGGSLLLRPSLGELDPLC